MPTHPIKVPKHLRYRPVVGGYVVPFFVSWYKDGVLVHEKTEGARPDFPTIDVRRLVTCRKQNRCWICGNGLKAFKTFVFGPASALVQMSTEPPSHPECANYAVQVCPFIIDPTRLHVSEKPGFKLKEGQTLMPEVGPGNPGVAIIWTTRSYEFHMPDPSRGMALFEPGEPERIEFWHRGQPATHKQAMDGFQQAITANHMMETNGPIELAWRVARLLKFMKEPEHEVP